ncbi:hypothetical protein [Streptomyces sp. H27-D2]|uniref:hypothetical protein n=1 Tax=Streptomyces sp. H27-D2 TaxID=3046304 RepID=UPI002DBBBEAF|nr:hypothetical protein [Streptomyces sp. H27-D2]MEC4016750.1 hypothetical protein [Streptomyces sp. H27-D2]
MMYNVLIACDAVPTGLAQALANAFATPLGSVDVSPSSELEARNWDATVTCEYEGIRGDLDWMLTVYAAEEVAAHPSEESLSLALAQSLGVSVLYPWGTLPWIRKVATPPGELTYARIEQPEGEEGEFRVTAVELPVPDFPGAAVGKLPEIVKDLPIPTPLADDCVPPIREAGWKNIHGLLANWERLASRMAAKWPPSGWYPADMYREDLECRDELENLIAPLPESARARIQDALMAVDSSYREGTVDDGGRALAARTDGLESAEIALRPWYWHRRPATVPWEQ